MNVKRILLVMLLGSWALPTQARLALADGPLFLSSTEPRLMLLMSRDHLQSIKAYNDYSDLTGDGVLDTSYTDSAEYYGYFDSHRCYTYQNDRFEPTNTTTGTGHECSGAYWSGNFLNWATMTRLDVVRKVLYGGFRSTDSTGTDLGATVLERAFLPPDVHAFAKVYAPAAGATDVAKFTPYSMASITLCNVTDMGFGQRSGEIDTANGNTTSRPPLIKVAEGSWPQWAMTEIVQCQWKTQEPAELAGSATRPPNDKQLASGLIARVAVCAPGALEDNCKSYFTRATPPVETVKPVGLLQNYSDVDAVHRVRFGLMTGSYMNNAAGGVLRKNVHLLVNNRAIDADTAAVCGDNDPADEIDVCTGRFINQTESDQGIIDALTRIHIADYQTAARGTITERAVCVTAYGNTCDYTRLGLNGNCRDWGNPLAQMYYEALRYFAGKATATAAYQVDDGVARPGFNLAIRGLGYDTWDAGSDPLPATEWCGLSNIVVLSTGLTSFDNTAITSDIAGLDPAGLTNTVGAAEGVNGGNFLIGSNGTISDNKCSNKNLSNLASASGICPEVPHMKGGYLIGGLAKVNRDLDLRPGYASQRRNRWDGFNADWVARQPVGNFMVSLAENMPSFEITVGSGKVTLLPACGMGATAPYFVCNMTDLRVENQTVNSAGVVTSASFLVSWGDLAAGGDYDMDVIARLAYCVGAACNTLAFGNDTSVGANQLKVVVYGVQAATGAEMNLGYTVSGTTADGTVFPIHLPGTATCDPTECGTGSANRNYFSLMTSPSSWRCGDLTHWESCSATGPRLPDGSVALLPKRIVDNTACPAGGQCGCPKATVYTQTSTPAALLKNPLWYAAKYGAPSSSWDLKNNVTGVLGPDGVPDNFFDVRDPAKLYSTLAAVFDIAAQADASAAAVATNSTSLQISSRVFQARFSASDWNGQLLSYKFSSGALTATPEWDAGEKINAQDPINGRTIITRGSSGGVPFSYSSLTIDQRALLDQDASGTIDGCGALRVAYVRGSDTWEGSTGAIPAGTCTVAGRTTSKFRQRLYTKGNARLHFKLGDIVNSSPWYVGKPSAGFSDVEYPGYEAFSTAKANRTPVVYVGGNDGMLHGFDAGLVITPTDPIGTPTATGGNELLAYVPTQVMSNLPRLSAQDYKKNHRYFVDGSPIVADADLGGSLGWRTVLVGALGGGGQGYYALDVSDPAGTFRESEAGQVSLWEFNEPDMGNVFNLPASSPSTNQAKQIVRVCTNSDCTSSKWAVVLGNGYNSQSGKAVLYVVFIADGSDGVWSPTDFVKIVVDAPVAPASDALNGLSTPVPIDSNGDGYADEVYAGDLKGNLWKFLIGTNAGDPSVTGDTTTWKVAFSGAGCPTAAVPCTPLFTARITDTTTGVTTAQPIISPPEVAFHPERGVLVFIGTGKYLEPADSDPNAVQTLQTMYGIWDPDDGRTRVGDRATELLQQTMIGAVTTAGGNYRLSSANPINWTTHKGWYLDLLDGPSASPTGERTVGIPKVVRSLLFFNTFIPSRAPCDAGGSGWLMSLDWRTGGMPNLTVFDTNADGVIDSADLLSNSNASGYEVGGAPGGTTIIPGGAGTGSGVGVSSLTTGQLVSTLLNIGVGNTGRFNWREIVQ